MGVAINYTRSEVGVAITVISVVFVLPVCGLCQSLYSAWTCPRFLVCHIMLVLSISCCMNRY